MGHNHLLETLAIAVIKLLERNMADFAALNAKVSEFGASIDAVAAKVDDLKAQIAAGAPDQQAEVDAVLAAIDALKARVDALVA